MPILVLFDGCGLDPLVQFLLSVLEQASAHDLEAVIEVLQTEDDSDAACECLHFRAPVAQLRHELLDARDLVRDVQVGRLLHGTG